LRSDDAVLFFYFMNLAAFIILPSLLVTITSSVQSTAGVSALNKELERELIEMGNRDQTHRLKMTELINLLSGPDKQKASEELSQLVRGQDQIDQENRNRLDKIVKQYGWPTIRLVGRRANQAAFLIVQHAELSYQKKYFPLIKEAAAKQEAEPGDVAMLEDRILKGEGKKQVYGTQVNLNESTKKWELWPIEDEESVDARRARVGMGPLAEYLKAFGIEYKPPNKNR
jgi:Family of unknown function (DUF6624)